MLIFGIIITHFFGEIKMAWDDDKKAQAVSMYEEQDPTPETSMKS